MNRRVLLGSGLATGLGLMLGHRSFAAEAMRDTRYVQDFDELWTTLCDHYCFFQEKRTDWEKVRELYRPIAIAAASDEEFMEVARLVLAELYDAHTHLSDPPVGAPRWPPYDVKAARIDGAVGVIAVDEGSAASQAGLKPGDLILAVDGRPVAQVIADLMPHCLTSADPEADDHAVNVAVAGHRGRERRFVIARAGESPREIALPLIQGTPKPDLEWERLAGGRGYIAIRSFADEAVVDSFDEALLALRDAPGLIIDVRNNGGGDTAIARPIMGRFISETKPYAMMRRREGAGLGPFWTEYVEPRGPFTYSRPVVVLTNYWSGSMAEGFPMGMRGIGRATIVGTRMMGLGAAVFPLSLDRTGIQAQYSAEPVYDIQRNPRWLLKPDVEVPLGHDIVAAGLAELSSKGV